MDESGTYGQFGEAVYDNEDHHWHFQRSKTAPHLLELPGETKIIVESDGRTQNKIFPADGKEGPTRRREKQVQALVRRNPEFQPGSGFLTDLARISEAVEESASRHDPTIGNLLAFGTTTDELARQQVEIVAFPTGPTGSDLRIVQVRKQRRGWHDLKNVHLQVPTIHGEEATWTGPGVPIQSIAFANPLEGTDPFLAVRLIMQTLIFRPVLRKKVVSNGSRLDVNFLVSVDLDQTGNQPHADVAFNPWYARQFAILDQAGCFTIWELDGKSLMKVNRVAFNRSTMENPKSGESASGDCWGRAIWVCSPSILAVCRRRNLKIFEIEGDHLLERHDLDNGLTDFGWILDMVQVPSQLGYIVVATSQHLVVYYVKHATPSKVAQVRHFRNSEDISLQLYCFSDGDDTLVFLRSDLDQTVLIYRLHLDGKCATTVGDPVELVSYAGPTVRSTGLCALHFSSVDIKGEFKNAVGEPKLDSDIHDARFLQLTILHKNHSVRQTLCATSVNAETVLRLGAPTWERDLTKSAHKVLDDDFIVNDDADEVQEHARRSEPVSNFIRRFRKPQAPDARKWTVNHELTERRLNHVDVSDVMSMDEALEAAREALADGATGDYLPFRTLKELAEIEVTLQNLESASSELQGILLDHDAPQRKSKVDLEEAPAQQDTTLTLRSMASLPILGVPSTGEDHLSAIYEIILDLWIRHMPENISDIVRHSNEQLARRIAADVSLASLVIRTPSVEPELQTQSQSQSQSQGQGQGQVWELPVRPGAPPSSRTTPSMTFDAVGSPKSPRLPTPSETGSSSSVPASNLALGRLSRYTTFTSNPTSPPLSRRLNRVLSHWPVGADPATYDWASASRHITRRDEEEVEGEEMTEKERQRMQRRTERYARRQRREAEETARLQLLSSQAPEIVVGSQPARLVRAHSQQAAGGAESLSQSQSQSQGRLVASQVLPGRDGGRKPAKKKRKSGF